MKKICPKCESKFDFEDPKYRYCPYCAIELKPFVEYGKKPKYNPSSRQRIDETIIELKPTPWTDNKSHILEKSSIKKIVIKC